MAKSGTRHALTAGIGLLLAVSSLCPIGCTTSKGGGCDGGGAACHEGGEADAHASADASVDRDVDAPLDAGASRDPDAAVQTDASADGDASVDASSSACAPDASRSCHAGNGTGSQTCNGSGSGWGVCGDITSCDPDYVLEAGACLRMVHLTFVATSESAFATFQSNSQKVLSNSAGYFLTFLAADGGDTAPSTWQLMQSTDGGATFVRIYEESSVGSRAPALETDGWYLYLAYPDWLTGDSYVLKF